ncbi:MAG TPA: protease [Bacilli bacterium]|nr:protease [Bacilli bacterium]
MNSIILLIKKIRIHPLFVLVLGIGVITGYFREVLMVFVTVFIHEMGHAVAAHFFKWPLKKIELLPFGGVAEVNDDGNRPFYEEAIIIITGPLQHLWLIGASYLLQGTWFWTAADHKIFLIHNLTILLFNLLPILPLDGGRLVQLLFMYYYPYKRALKVSLYWSAFMLACFIIVSLELFPFHLNLWVVISFLVVNHYLQWKQRHYRYLRFLYGRQRLANETLRPIPITISIETEVRSILELLRRGCFHSFLVVEAMGKHVHYLDEKQVIGATIKEKAFTKRVKELI